jgi:Holliday junction DNA helicase RuvA
MIAQIRGRVLDKTEAWAVIEMGGIGFKVFLAPRTMAGLPAAGHEVRLFTYLAVKEDALDLYGFLDDRERSFFEQLISVSGVGPRSALAILSVADVPRLAAAIREGRPDLLTQAAGIGRKTAERIVVELRNRVGDASSGATVATMESDTDALEALMNLGYRREDARDALARVGPDVAGVESRLKAALKLLAGKK